MNYRLYEIAQQELALHGEIRDDARAAILLQQVIVGMTPFEAKLAGGAFAFRVRAAMDKWPPNIDPFLVIDAQHAHPDDSEIWATFENDTQFPGEGRKKFEVYFVRGKAEKIERI